mmetsp:Transcript_119047/g.333507  ORF Transcript_119047/g.333507 Transcript_119047/m.333507 type:complete len:287 (+) Transcript_119047:20-880(+)
MANSRPCRTLAAPLNFSSTIPVSPSTLTISTDPPMAIMAGLIRLTSMATISNESSFGLPSPSSTWRTSPKFAKFSFRTRSIPICIVTVDDGHDPQAPSSFKYTFRVSSSTRSTETFPPSLIRYGRTSSRTLSTFSLLKTFCSSAVVVTDAVLGISKGETTPSPSSATAAGGGPPPVAIAIASAVISMNSMSSSSKSSRSKSSSSSGISMAAVTGSKLILPPALDASILQSSAIDCMAPSLGMTKDMARICATFSAPNSSANCVRSVSKSKETPICSHCSHPAYPLL